jgi:hypothetical protein
MDWAARRIIAIRVALYGGKPRRIFADSFQQSAALGAQHAIRPGVYHKNELHPRGCAALAEAQIIFYSDRVLGAERAL